MPLVSSLASSSAALDGSASSTLVLAIGVASVLGFVAMLLISQRSQVDCADAAVADDAAVTTAASSADSPLAQSSARHFAYGSCDDERRPRA